MSIALMSRVMESPLGSPTDKLVLLVLADCANDDGMNVFPSVATIARRCDMSDRAVQMSLRRMTEKGWISVAGKMRVKTGLVTRYRIHSRNLPTPQTTGETDAPVNDVHQRGECDSPVGVNDVHQRGEPRSPNPSINHQSRTTIESSAVESARAIDHDAAARAAGIHNQKPPRKSRKVEPPAQATITHEQLSHFAVSAHREIISVLLDAFVVQQIIAHVTDETAWRECLTDWRLHPGWKRDNIAGQLDRYARWAEIKAQGVPALRHSQPVNGAGNGATTGNTLTGAARIAHETYERQMSGIQSAVEAAMAGGWNGNA